MLKIGITGGIGSGKSTICMIFQILQIPVYYSDLKAKWLMSHDDILKQNIISTFGNDSYTPNGYLNSKYLAKIVFKSSEQLRILNSLVHPAVAKDYIQWHQLQTESPFTLKEAALLYESGSAKQLDKIIVVDAPESIRIQRVMQRDSVESSAVKDRIRNQMDAAEKRDLADFIINNDGSELLVPQVLNIYDELCSINN